VRELLQNSLRKSARKEISDEYSPLRNGNNHEGNGSTSLEISSSSKRSRRPTPPLRQDEEEELVRFFKD
jgi:hypothetical protein